MGPTSRNGIKAIETRYKGCRFRSRLEARWAVFFDAMGITWLYEHEGFALSDGTAYLPDFYLPTFDGWIYAEVKPSESLLEFSASIRFAKELNASIWLCGGLPDVKAYRYCDFREARRGWCYACDTYTPCKCSQFNWGIPNADSARGENRFFAQPGYEDEFGYLGTMIEHVASDIGHAVIAARSARFEHGEQG